MIGRKVKCRGLFGEVSKWTPLSVASCDALVTFQNGRECWFASHELVPIDALGPLPSRDEAREAARAERLESLKAIRRQHAKTFVESWPGAEFGKVVVGQALDGAIDEAKGEP